MAAGDVHPADLDDELTWVDVIGMSMLAGVGFTVSLLIGGSPSGGTPKDDHVKVAVLVGSLAAAPRRRRYCAPATGCTGAERDEERDNDLDGVPDVYQQGDDSRLIVL